MIGKRLKELRIGSGLSQSAFGDVVGVAQQSVYQWEKDKNDPDLATLLRIADYFNVSADYLLGRTEGPTGNIVYSETKEGIPIISKTVDGKPLSEKDRELANAAELRAMDQPGVELDERVRRLVDERVRELLNRVIPEGIDKK